MSNMTLNGVFRDRDDKGVVERFLLEQGEDVAQEIRIEVASAQEAELREDFDRAEAGYRRALRLVDHSTVLKEQLDELHRRRE